MRVTTFKAFMWSFVLMQYEFWYIEVMSNTQFNVDLLTMLKLSVFSHITCYLPCICALFKSKIAAMSTYLARCVVWGDAHFSTKDFGHFHRHPVTGLTIPWLKFETNAVYRKIYIERETPSPININVKNRNEKVSHRCGESNPHPLDCRSNVLTTTLRRPASFSLLIGLINLTS